MQTCGSCEGFILADILRDFKRHTAKQILTVLQNKTDSRSDWILKLLEEVGSKNKKNKKYHVWSQDNHPIELYSAVIMDQKLNYIHNNAVKEGIVQNPEDYLFSSTGFCVGHPSLISLTRLE